MKIVEAFPPNFAEILQAFPDVPKTAIFCYGDTIYNPGRIKIGPDLIAHEKVHAKRQAAFPGGPAAWWDGYLNDPQFRLDEEVPAHRAELAYWARQPSINQPARGFRSVLMFHELQIAGRLASSLYGNLVSLAQARSMIAQGA